MNYKIYVIPSEARLESHTIELSVDVDVVVVVVVDVVDVDSRCRIGEMAARIMTKLGTVALQVRASFSSES